MLHRRWKRPAYSLPPHLKKQKNRSKEGKSTPLVQPEWDDTIHDLTAFRASPEDVLLRKLSRTSHNQMGLAMMQSRQPARSASQQQQQRYSGSVSGGEDSEEDDDTGHSHPAYTQQQQHGPRVVSLLQQDHTGQQQQRQQQQATSALSQHACSTEDSKQEDVCQWQSPTRPSLQQRQALQDIGNSRQHSAAVGPCGGRTRVRGAWQQRLQQQPDRQLRGSSSSTVSVDADMLQALLDKVSLLEGQLHQMEQLQQQQPQCSELQQQLAQSTEQLAATQQELSQLQQEHRQLVAHTTTILTQLQTQVQKLLMGQHAMPSLPLDTVQQQEASAYSRLLQPPAAGLQQQLPGAGAAATRSSAAGLMQISSLIRQQLQQQQETGAQQPEANAHAAAAADVNSAATASPAAERVQAARTAGSACSSPSRTKAALHFTPAVADTLQLPSYATMQQRDRGMAAAAAVAAAAAGTTATQQGSAGAQDTIGRLRAGLEAAAAAVATGRPGRHTAFPRQQQLHAQQAPEAISTEAAAAGGLQRQQQHRPAAGGSEAAAASGSDLPSLSVRVPAAQAAAAAVWEAELSSPHPEQMQVPGEQAHYHLSNAAAESVMEAPAFSVAAAVSTELAALLRDLGLGSLCSATGEVAAVSGCPEPFGNSSGGSAAGGALKAAAGAVAAASGGAKVVLSEAAAAPTAAAAPGLLDVDWGLQEGLPRAAVSRVFTAAGCVSAATDVPKPRVLPAQLQTNMCFRDYLLAAQAAAADRTG